MGRLIRRVLFRCRNTFDGHLSRDYVAAALQQSTRELGGQPWRSLLILLRTRFTQPTRSLGPLVVSYTTVSPLPLAR